MTSSGAVAMLTRLPGEMINGRTLSATQHTADHLAGLLVAQRHPGTALQVQLVMFAGEQLLRHANCGQAGHHAQMRSDARAPRVGDAVAVGEYQVGNCRQFRQRLQHGRQLAKR